jgi:hypothetical protein
MIEQSNYMCVLLNQGPVHWCALRKWYPGEEVRRIFGVTVLVISCKKCLNYLYGYS